MKKILSLLLAAVLTLGLTVPALAASPKEADQAAWALYHLGLFQGVGTDAQGFPDFDLDAVPTRAQGVTMLVRLLGKEEEALSGNWNAPFTDVPSWAAPYVGYAWDQGLTKGTGGGLFSPDAPITATEYLTLVLRAMGYDSEEDFSWDQAWNLSDALEITDGQYGPLTDSFDRGDVAWISYHALDGTLKGRANKPTQTLRQSLAKAGIESNADQCVWEETLQACREDQMVFTIAPVRTSPRTYTRFVVDKAWANGLPCQVEQYSTRQAMTAELKNLSKDDRDSVSDDSFALIRLTYDEAAVLAAAADTVTVNGRSYPVIRFQLETTGTLAGLPAVKEKAQFEYYILGYFGSF